MKTTTSTPQLTNPDEAKKSWLKVGELRYLDPANEWHLTLLDIADLMTNYSKHPVTSDPKEYAARAISFVRGHIERAAPQPANTLPSGCPYGNDDCPKCKPTDKTVATPTTPIETNPVNAWMLANGWEHSDVTGGFWYKPTNSNGAPKTVSDAGAAEMYRMSEVRVAEEVNMHLDRLSGALPHYGLTEEAQNLVLTWISNTRWSLDAPKGEDRASTRPDTQE